MQFLQFIVEVPLIMQLVDALFQLEFTIMKMLPLVRLTKGVSLINHTLIGVGVGQVIFAEERQAAHTSLTYYGQQCVFKYNYNLVYNYACKVYICINNTSHITIIIDIHRNTYIYLNMFPSYSCKMPIAVISPLFVFPLEGENTLIGTACGLA